MMKRSNWSRWACLLVAVAWGLAPAVAQNADDRPRVGDQMVDAYFRAQTQLLTDRTFAEIESLEDWENRRGESRRQLLEMLGLDPMPEKTPLQAVVTGTHEEAGVVVENVHFQAMPGLYVTGNFYRPVDQQGPLPAVLYVCGHARVKADGISYGNKAHYQHHAGWFARNGYVCFTIDTVQLGEIEGIHHGTYRENMWWWNNRGYSSAGVEAYNCVRALDYLQSRQEVDPERIGVTGRSGGGVYSWWVAAIDERIKVAVPVAGITSLKNHVVDGCVEGHCDCMFMVNTYRWDFPMIAALVAPRPLLITNSDKDRIFPLDGVVDVYTKARRIYSLYGAEEKLGLQISEGPHKDTQELRIAAFRWMNRFLRNDESLIEMAATPLFEKEQLRVFDSLPADERTSNIHESFVPKAEAGTLDLGDDGVARQLIKTLREKTFRGWPDQAEPLELSSRSASGAAEKAELIQFNSQTPFRLPIYLLHSQNNAKREIEIRVLDEAGWNQWAPALAVYFPKELAHVAADTVKAASLRSTELTHDVAFVVPRGVGPTAWSDDERAQTHIRRRFMLLGQTLAGMQIYDLIRSIDAVKHAVDVDRVTLTARGDATVWAVYASLMGGGVDALELEALPESNRQSPDLLNVSRFVELPDVVSLAKRRLHNAAE